MSPVVLVALFGAGLTSFLAPCVVPLVPAYLGMMAVEAAERPSRLVAAAVWFVGGFSTVFVLLGAASGRLGGLVPLADVVGRVGGVVVLAFGVVLLLGGRVLRERRFVPTSWPAGAIVRPYVIGLTFGAAWTPCVGPLLGAALTVAATSGRGLSGAALLASYSAGLGLPFVLAPVVLAARPTLAARLSRVGARATPIAAVLLVGLGVLMTTGTYVRALGPIARVAPGGA